MDARAVALQEVLDPRQVQAALAREPPAAVPQHVVALGADQRRHVGGAGRDGVVEPARGGVDRVARHHPVGRVLAARHGDEPGHRHRHGVLARELARALRLAGQQRPQPGVDALDVLVAERLGEHAVDVLEHVVDVGAAGRGVRLVELPVRVRRPDDPVAAPRDHEQHALLGAQDQPAVDLDAVARDHEVDALGRAHLELAALADQVLDVVGPHPGGVDHLARLHLELLVGEVVVDAHAGHAPALAQEPDHRARSRRQRRRRRPRCGRW